MAPSGRPALPGQAVASECGPGAARRTGRWPPYRCTAHHAGVLPAMSGAACPAPDARQHTAPRRHFADVDQHCRARRQEMAARPGPFLLAYRRMNGPFPSGSSFVRVPRLWRHPSSVCPGSGIRARAVHGPGLVGARSRSRCRCRRRRRPCGPGGLGAVAPPSRPWAGVRSTVRGVDVRARHARGEAVQSVRNRRRVAKGPRSPRSASDDWTASEGRRSASSPLVSRHADDARRPMGESAAFRHPKSPRRTSNATFSGGARSQSG